MSAQANRDADGTIEAKRTNINGKIVRRIFKAVVSIPFGADDYSLEVAAIGRLDWYSTL
jgi:hypothetical protein